MEILTCSRNNCESILCYTHIDDIGYICDDCEIEFKDHLYKKNINISSYDDIFKELIIFVSSEKDENSIDEITLVDEYFHENRI